MKQDKLKKIEKADAALMFKIMEVSIKLRAARVRLEKFKWSKNAKKYPLQAKAIENVIRNHEAKISGYHRKAKKLWEAYVQRDQE